jgi:phospholipid:diacylglycerol acyltransferase
MSAQVVVASHSWGDNVFRNFMLWAIEGDPDWVERHIAAYINIAGPTLGVAKSMTSLLSGARLCAPLLHPCILATAQCQMSNPFVLGHSSCERP